MIFLCYPYIGDKGGKLLDRIVYIYQGEKNKDKENLNLKEVAQDMKKSNIINFAQAAKKQILLGGGTFLAAMAIVFAAAPCSGIFYEPEVPGKLQ